MLEKAPSAFVVDVDDAFRLGRSGKISVAKLERLGPFGRVKHDTQKPPPHRFGAHRNMI